MATWLTDIPRPTPVRILEEPILIQHTTDHIWLWLMCAKGACILLNQFTYVTGDARHNASLAVGLVFALEMLCYAHNLLKVPSDDRNLKKK